MKKTQSTNEEQSLRDRVRILPHGILFRQVFSRIRFGHAELTGLQLWLKAT